MASIRRAILLVMILPFAHSSTATAADLLVPEDFPTIQAAITAAVPGDSVLVKAGTYKETISFLGKAIRVVSRDGIGKAAIDLSGMGHGLYNVQFVQNEGRDSVLWGFKISGNDGLLGFGGSTAAILITSSPTIQANVIRDNGEIMPSSGIYNGCHGISNSGSPLIIGNTLRNNQDWQEGGGGILTNGGAPVIMNNIIDDNLSWEGNGGGIDDIISGTATITGNLVTHNQAGYSGGAGGGIFGGGTIVNNTIVDNWAVDGGGVFTNGTVMNCIVWNNTAMSHPQIGGHGTVTYCDTNQDPLFVDGFHLSSGSPCIDTGAPGFVPAPGAEHDLDGNSRLLNGKLTGSMVVDIGAYEFTNVRLAITGTLVPGGTLTIDTSGTSGLPNLLLIGFSPATLLIDPFGYLGIDPSHFFWAKWPPAPSSVTVGIPTDITPGLSLVFQELVIAGLGLGNFSNSVPIVFG
jgi:hypothetical protein